MNIGIIGASGLIGRSLVRLASDAGHSVVGFSRSVRKPAHSNLSWRIWDQAPDCTGLDVIINVAGESVAQRWTDAKKAEFVESRIGVTQAIVRQLSALPEANRPRTLINASAVGYYGDCGDTLLNEESDAGRGYLSDLCVDWEQAAMEADALGVRVVLGRIGIVFGEHADAWKKMETVFRFGLGGPLGNGQQWMPWVHVDDVAGAMIFCAENEEVNGAVNLVSPDPRRNSDLTRVLARQLKRPAIFPAPKFGLELVFGEFGKHLLDSYRVHPDVLTGAKYPFYYNTLESCFAELID